MKGPHMFEQDTLRSQEVCWGP